MQALLCESQKREGGRGGGGIGYLRAKPTKSTQSAFHLQHFQNDLKLCMKLESLIDHASHCPHLTPNETHAAVEMSNMYHMQKEAKDELSPVMQLKLSKELIHLVRTQAQLHSDCM